MNKTLPKDEVFKLWVLLHQTRHVVFKIREKELKKYGISVMESGVLFILHTLGGKSTPAEISRWIFREHHTVSALLERMQKKGLIKKARDPNRKNIWSVSLTEKGRNAYSNSTKMDSLYNAISALSENECKQLESILRKMRDRALKRTVGEPTIPFP